MRNVRLEILSDNDKPVDAEIRIESETGNPGSGNYKIEESIPVTSGTADARRSFDLVEGQRIVILPRGKDETYVYDKDQNAHVRVASEEEVKAREEREKLHAKAAADQEVRAARAEANTTQELGAKAQQEANTRVKQAEQAAAKVENQQPKPVTAPLPHPQGKPASANTGPIDSKQIKADNTTPNVKPSNG